MWNNRRILLGTTAYVGVTFPLAALWHVVFFKAFYESVGYLGGEPSFLLGFLAILFQGLILSAGFDWLPFAGGKTKRGLKYAFFMGIFFWTSHILAHAAKNPLGRTLSFFLLESLYLSLQFGIFGLLIGHCGGKKESF